MIAATPRYVPVTPFAKDAGNGCNQGMVIVALAKYPAGGVPENFKLSLRVLSPIERFEPETFADMGLVTAAPGATLVTGGAPNTAPRVSG